MTFRKMDAKSLKLPHGLGDAAWKFGPLRVAVQYRIGSDSFIARFDSVIDDEEQYNCAFEQNLSADESMSARDFGWLCFPFAMRAFREGKITKGSQLATPVLISFNDF